MTHSSPPLCAYCGSQPGITRDHPVPRGLFTRPLPALMVTVPACLGCNAVKAGDETYLRDALVLQGACERHPVARALIQGPILRASRTNRSEFLRAARRDARAVPLQTPTGLYAGQGVAVPLDWGRVAAAVERTVRGLYFQLRGDRFPDGYRFEVWHRDTVDGLQVWEGMRLHGANGPYTLGDGVFSCRMMVAEEDPGITLWLLWFYGTYAIEVDTRPADGER